MSEHNHISKRKMLSKSKWCVCNLHFYNYNKFSIGLCFIKIDKITMNVIITSVGSTRESKIGTDQQFNQKLVLTLNSTEKKKIISHSYFSNNENHPNRIFFRTLWKGPRICSPAYDLKFLLTKCVIIKRGAPGSLVMAGGGGGGMLPRISSKLRSSTTSAPCP